MAPLLRSTVPSYSVRHSASTRAMLSDARTLEKIDPESVLLRTCRFFSRRLGYVLRPEQAANNRTTNGNATTCLLRPGDDDSSDRARIPRTLSRSSSYPDSLDCRR